MRELFRLEATEADIATWLNQFQLTPCKPVHGGEHLVVRQSHARHMQANLLRLGLPPYFVSKHTVSQRTMEVYVEEMIGPSLFASALKRRRCLIPATHIVEESSRGVWGAAGSCFAQEAGDIFALAGVWQGWDDESCASQESFAVVTCAPTLMLRLLFERMPIVIAPQHFARWLDCSSGSAVPIDLLGPMSVADLKTWSLMPDVHASAEFDSVARQP